ncbi:MAG: TetR/AcrR family transcriptional regulator [Solirubrobacterales bacterium]
MARPKNQTARRRQLTQAARRAIATRGIEAVRIKDVAAEAGMSPQSVLYYYPDLDTLIEQAIQHVVERFAERRRQTADELTDPRAALIAMIRDGLPDSADDEDLRITYNAAGYFRDNPTLGAHIRSMTARQVDVYRQILDHGQSTGAFTLADTSQTIARNLVALEDAYGLYIISGGQIADEALRMLLSFASIATGCQLARLTNVPEPPEVS